MYPLRNQEYAYVSFDHPSNSTLCSSHIIVGLNFGVLIAWIGISCFTLPTFQWIVRRRDVIAERTAMPYVPQQSEVLVLEPMQKVEPIQKEEPC